MLDVDGDGFVERHDLESLAERMCDRFLGESDFAGRATVREGFEELWSHLIANSDSDHDGKLSPEEYMVALERGILADDDHYMRAIDRPLTVVFNSLDSDHDGALDESEFSSLGEAVGLGGQDSSVIFSKLDTDGDGQVSLAEFQAALREFYFGDDAESPGAHQFGTSP